MPRKLKRPVFDRVDLVDAGANQEADILLYKRQEPQEEPETGLPQEVALESEQAEEVQKMDEEPMTVNQIVGYDEACRQFWHLYDALACSIHSIMEHGEPGQKLGLLRQTCEEFSAQVANIVPVVMAKHEDKAEDMEMALASLKKVRSQRGAERQMQVIKALVGEPPPMELAHQEATEGVKDMEKLEEITKRLAEAEAKLAEVATLEKRAADAEAQLAVAKELARVEVEKRLEQEYLAKAKALTALPLEPDTDWKVLRAIDTLDEPIAKRVQEVLTSANEMIAQSGLFKTVGFDGARATSGTAFEQVSQLAQEKVAKGLAKDISTATSAVFSERPDLYELHRKESSARS